MREINNIYDCEAVFEIKPACGFDNHEHANDFHYYYDYHNENYYLNAEQNYHSTNN